MDGLWPEVCSINSGGRQGAWDLGPAPQIALYVAGPATPDGSRRGLVDVSPGVLKLVCTGVGGSEAFSEPLSTRRPRSHLGDEPCRH